MSNRTFNRHVVPTLQPDPDRPGSTTDDRDPVPAAIRPRRPTPETGFERGQPAEGPGPPLTRP